MTWIDDVRAWLHPSANDRRITYLAREMDTAPSHLGRLLNGKATPSLEYLERLSFAMSARGRHIDPNCPGCVRHPVALTLDGARIVRTSPTGP
jgi:hypothetical protein